MVDLGFAMDSEVELDELDGIITNFQLGVPFQSHPRLLGPFGSIQRGKVVEPALGFADVLVSWAPGRASSKVTY